MTNQAPARPFLKTRRARRRNHLPFSLKAALKEAIATWKFFQGITWVGSSLLEGALNKPAATPFFQRGIGAVRMQSHQGFMRFSERFDLHFFPLDLTPRGHKKAARDSLPDGLNACKSPQRGAKVLFKRTFSVDHYSQI